MMNQNTTVILNFVKVMLMDIVLVRMIENINHRRRHMLGQGLIVAEATVVPLNLEQHEPLDQQ